MEAVKATRNRNPAFPAVDLGRALELAEKLYEKETRKPFAPETAASHWDYSLKSSGALQAVSALKQFGLLLEDGDGNKRKLRLSEPALTIIIGKRTNSPERAKALQEVALTPKVYSELWSKADESGLPSDTELENYLLLERKPPFYEEAVKGLIKDFRSTIRLAKLEKNDILDRTGGTDGGNDPETTTPKPPKFGLGLMTPNAIPLTILTNDRSVAVVSIPQMSARAFDFLKSQLDLFRSAIVIDDSAPSQADPAPEK